MEQERRIRDLEEWRRDVAKELREWERWAEEVKPFIAALQADLIYRQRKHAESVGEWSRLAKILVTITGVLVCLSAVGGFVLAIYHAVHGGG